VRRSLGCLLAVLATIAGVSFAPPQAPAYTPEHLTARGAYLERCAGCHGGDGLGHTSLIPDLKGRAGYFLCSAESRDYMSRLPNIVFSRITDAEMAALLNYVTFDLGAKSAPAGARPFSAGELAAARREPLTIPDLEAYRAQVIDRLIARCGAPASLRSDYATVK
jgi:mono/diheme cytochrome c family protein